MVEVLQDAHHAARLRRRAVRGDGHEVELEGQANMPRQVRHQDEGALQHSDQQQVAIRVVGGDPRSEIANLLLDLLLGDQDAFDVGLEKAHVFVPPVGCESRTYSLSRRASNPAGSATRRPGRPAATSITASTCRTSPATPV